VKKYLIVAAISAAISIVSTSLYFIYGQGIHIHNTTHNEQYQNQSQAQLIIGLYSAKGKVSWACSTYDSIMEKYGSFDKYLNTLSPEQSLFSKRDDREVCIPTLQDK
jgi:hypothetical protein